jgi:hypothetical protein
MTKLHPVLKNYLIFELVLISVAAVAVALAFILASYAASPEIWAKPNTPVAQVDRDVAECQYEAEKATPNSAGDPIVAGLTDRMRETSLREQCLKIRGYQKR